MRIRAALDRGESIGQISRMTGASRVTMRRVGYNENGDGVKRALCQAERRVRKLRTPVLVEQGRQEIEANPCQPMNPCKGRQRKQVRKKTLFPSDPPK